MAFTIELLTDLTETCGFRITEFLELPGRPPVLVGPPDGLSRSVLGRLRGQYPSGLYSHQAKALEAALNGKDVCLSTSTASGKSLVFITYAIELLSREPDAKIVAFYPARALLQDQIGKWHQALEGTGFGVGLIDGGVAFDARPEILRSSDILLMTPDVAHAWMMSRLSDPDIRRFLAHMRLLVLDEAHVYEGVFGTNMAYFLRRLQAVSGPHQMICSTATVGEPADFFEQLTGREVVSVSREEEGSAVPDKNVSLLVPAGSDSFQCMTSLLEQLAVSRAGRFLAFADSRRMVEHVVAAIGRDAGQEDETSDEDQKQGGRASEVQQPQMILPYRAGYETEDRREIQDALATGRLCGVVSTSALELGIDIGDIEVVVLLGAPQTAKAFWQRIGRAGRQTEGWCLIVDGKNAVVNAAGALSEYLERPIEPSWLYLDNKYVQYSNALCAAYEISQFGEGRVDLEAYDSLPERFRGYVHNELDQTDIVDNDLYVLKQKAQEGPHHEFPIRSGVEQSFQVLDHHKVPLGNLSYGQVLREGYPGAIYYYLARPYRVVRYNYREGQLHTKPERHWTTRPLSQAMVFPRFRGGVLQLLQSEDGFVAECELQASERVLGFQERRGSAKYEELYGPGSKFHRTPLARLIQTTGACWYFPDKGLISDDVARRLLQAFCLQFGIQERDLGYGLFHANQTPLSDQRCQGMCIFDGTNGSLRLTQLLVEHFSGVLLTAINVAKSQYEMGALGTLAGLASQVDKLTRVRITGAAAEPDSLDNDWVTVVARDQRAMYNSDDGPKEVMVLGFRYTPQGLVYDLEPPKRCKRWTVMAEAVQPIHGETEVLKYNLVTGEEEP